jgi:hypothetical protein
VTVQALCWNKIAEALFWNVAVEAFYWSVSGSFILENCSNWTVQDLSFFS